MRERKRRLLVKNDWGFSLPSLSLWEVSSREKLPAWINESGGRCTEVAWNKVHDGEVISVTNDRTRSKSRMTKMLLSTQTKCRNINIQYAMKLECWSGGRDRDFMIFRSLSAAHSVREIFYVAQANLLPLRCCRCRFISAWMCPSCEQQMCDRSSRIDNDLRVLEATPRRWIAIHQHFVNWNRFHIFWVLPDILRCLAMKIFHAGDPFCCKRFERCSKNWFHLKTPMLLSVRQIPLFCENAICFDKLF